MDDESIPGNSIYQNPFIILLIGTQERIYMKDERGERSWRKTLDCHLPLSQGLEGRSVPHITLSGYLL